MSKTTFSQNSFNNGEISPRALGRWDHAKYANSVKLLENFLVYQLGGIMYRPGTVYVATAKTSAKDIRLIPFLFNITQAYIVEMGDKYFRYYANDGQVLSAPATPAETTTTYDAVDLFNIHYAQNADTMYLVHPSYPPRKLVRTSSTTFSITDVPFVRGPFMDKNVSATTITPSADTGTGITLTASVASFDVKHIDSLWRIKSGVVKIKTVATGGLKTTCTADVQAEPTGVAGNLGTGPAATTDWAEGAFSGYRGYPSTVTFHQQRLYYANTNTEPEKFWGSTIAAYDDFNAGTASDDDAVTFEIVADTVANIQWMLSTADGFLIGTWGGVFTAIPSSGTITASNPPNIKQDVSYGVSIHQPRRLSSFAYFIQKSLFQVREVFYNYLYNRQMSKDMNQMADHVLRDGIGAFDISHQQSPMDRIWIVRNDGQIAVLTRNSEEDVLGWSRIKTAPTKIQDSYIESIATIPVPDDDDEIWIVVRRYINGAWVRYIEYFTKEHFDYDWDPVRLDSALTYDSYKIITAATKAKPVVITSATHGFNNGDQIKIDNVVGMTELNGNIYIVANKGTNSFELTDENGDDIDGTGFTAYISDGEIRKMITSVTGLSHLEGESVSVVVDGGLPTAQQIFTVSGGAITLLEKAAVIHVGLPYIGTVQLLKLSDGSQTGGQTKMRRIYLNTLRVYRSLNMLVGQDVNNLTRVYFRPPNEALGHATPLFTGDIEHFFDTWWSKDAEIVIQQDQPFPLFILCSVLRSEVEEKN